MRDSMRDSISETVNDLRNIGIPTSFTDKELKTLGINIPEVKVSADEIKQIRESIHLSQTVFAKLLNVSASSVKQWEQGKRTPTGSTKILLELLEKEPHLLDYRLSV
jgi:putative transcriptional regulator